MGKGGDRHFPEIQFYHLKLKAHCRHGTHILHGEVYTLVAEENLFVFKVLDRMISGSRPFMAVALAVWYLRALVARRRTGDSDEQDFIGTTE